MANHGLRTTGTHNGNFGAPRIQGKRDSLDISKETLRKDDLRIPERDEAFTKLVQAYNATTDPKLKAGLWEILKRRRATLQQPEVKSDESTSSEYWEEIKRCR